jgi:hypothetical protein
MPRYLTVEQVKAYHRSEIPTDDDEFIEAACDSAEATIDRETNRRFAVASGSSARVFAPTDPYRLPIFDAVSVSSITNNGQALTAGQYQLEPLNALTLAGESVPYTSIRRITGSWHIDPAGEALVSVTGSWGWTAIPDRIVQAALIIAKEIITNRDEVKLGLVGFSDVGGVTARTNPIVRDTLNHYRRYAGLVA